jgi:hypothetical protein
MAPHIINLVTTIDGDFSIRHVFIDCHSGNEDIKTVLKSYNKCRDKMA